MPPPVIHSYGPQKVSAELHLYAADKGKITSACGDRKLFQFLSKVNQRNKDSSPDVKRRTDTSSHEGEKGSQDLARGACPGKAEPQSTQLLEIAKTCPNLGADLPLQWCLPLHVQYHYECVKGREEFLGNTKGHRSDTVMGLWPLEKHQAETCHQMRTRWDA